MTTNPNIHKDKAASSMSKETKKKLNMASKALDEKVLFPEKLERAKKLVQTLNNRFNRLALQ